MIEVLLLHRRHPKQVVRAAVEQALSVGAIDPGAVAIIARHLESLPEQPPVQLSLAELGELARYERPAPETGGYDVLLRAVAE